MYISAIKVARVEYKHTHSTLQDREQEFAHSYANSPCPETLADLQLARRALNLHYQGIAHCSMRQRAERLFEERDKNGKLLVLRLSQNL